MQAVSIGGSNLGDVLQVGESPSPEVVVGAAPPIFKDWPKIVRLSKSVCIVIEKIDGTNAAFHIVEPWVSAMTFLREVGSVAMPGHRNPENLHKGQCAECGLNGNKHKMSCSAGSNE